MRRVVKLLGAVGCLVVAAALLPSGAWAQPGALQCRKVFFPVTLSSTDTQVYKVFGELCARGGLRNKTIHIALHGSTYNHTYWNWPFRPEIYSYVRQATTVGYAVLSLDRIGAGQSDRPPADAVTIGSNAFVVHQIVQSLRGGDLVVPGFGRVQAERVALVGHSLGSLIAIQEAGTYGDVDGIALTGISHTVTPALGEALNSLYPASLDRRFAGRNIPDGYLTSRPGDRTIFYQAPFFNPQVLALDERTKDTVTTAELNTAVPALAFSTSVHVPVLIAVGDFDLAFCNGPSCTESGSLGSEPGFYPADTCAKAVIIPKSGHDLNLHLRAPVTFDVILNWMDRWVGRDTRAPAPLACEP